MTEQRKQYLRDYQRRWMAEKRLQYFSDKSCKECGSTVRLELDHIDPSTKVNNCIWSWSKSRQQSELNKCQVLCHDCHLKKSIAYFKERFTGRPKPSRKIPWQTIEQIRCQLNSGMTERKVASMHGLGKTTVHEIKTGQIYALPL